MDKGQGGVVTVNSKGDIRIDFEYRHTSTVNSGTAGDYVMSVKKGVSVVRFDPHFGVRSSLLSSSGLRADMKGPTGSAIETAIIDIPTGTDVYVTAEKIGQSIRLSVFSEPERINHLVGSPTPLVDVSSIPLEIYDKVEGSSGVGIQQESGLLDDINVLGRVCTDYSIDARLAGTIDETFTLDAKLVRLAPFTIDALIKRLGDNCSLGLIFQDNIDSNAGWLVFNPLEVTVRVDGAFFPGEIEYFKFTNSFQARINKDLDQGQGGVVAIDSTKNIRLDIKYLHDSASAGSNGEGAMLMGVTSSNTGKITTRPRFGIKSREVGAQFKVRAQMFDGSTLIESGEVDVPDDTFVFMTATKVGDTIQMNVYSDEERTTHIATSPSTTANTSSLDQITYDFVGASPHNTFPGVIFNNGRLDDISVFTSICTEFSTDAIVQGPVSLPFTLDAIFVRDTKFTVSAFIKALGDIRCAPSFAEFVFFEDFEDTSNWSSEINNTGADGWGTQRIFIDDESPYPGGVSQENIQPNGPINGFVKASMPPEGS
jgi:hypothetical protein